MDEGDESPIRKIRRKYYTSNEVAMHNSAEDCWVSIYHQVYDLTILIKENRGILTQPLIQHAGEDISHWFDKSTKDVKTHLDLERNLRLPYLPYGRFLHVPPPEPVSNWSTFQSIPWWKDDAFCIGKLTEKSRIIEVINAFTQQSNTIEVCSEESLYEIQERYLEYNAHATSYTWKKLENDEFVPLDMSKTLSENGLPDEALELERLGINIEDYKTILHVYYNDDLTEG